MRFTDRFLNDNARRNRTTRQSNQTTSRNRNPGGNDPEDISEFRFYRRTNPNDPIPNHPKYLFRKIGNKYLGIGITHSPTIRTRNNRTIRNIRLERSPNPRDTRTNYITPYARRFNREQLHHARLRGWSFTENDNQKVKAIIDRYDEQHQ